MIRNLLLAGYVFGLLTSTLSAQAPAKNIYVALEYGPSTAYVDLRKDGAEPCQARVGRGFNAAAQKVPNLKSFAIGYKAWSLMGDFAFRPEFYWELDPLVLKGNTREVSLQKIAKYPSLERRYNAIAPLSVSFVIHLDMDGWSAQQLNGTGRLGTKATLSFKVPAYTLGITGSRSSRNITSPTTALNWTDLVSMRPLVRLSEFKDPNLALKNYFKESNRTWCAEGVNMDLDIKWPGDAIDQIAIDYDTYEKEGKDLEKEYKSATEPPKVLPRVDPVSEMQLPFEAEVKGAKEFSADGSVGLKSRDEKTIFESKDHVKIQKLNDQGTLFELRLKPEYVPGQIAVRQSQVITGSGKLLSVGGASKFLWFRPGERKGTYDFLVPKEGPPVFSTRKVYYLYENRTNGSPVFTGLNEGWFSSSEFERLKAYDMSSQIYDAYSVYANSAVLSFSEGKVYTVDSQFRVLSSAPVYYVSRAFYPAPNDVRPQGVFKRDQPRLDYYMN